MRNWSGGMEDVDMRGKTCVITGATSGIGQAAAKALVAMGARVIMVARSRARAEVFSGIRAPSPHARPRVYYADLSRLNDMKRIAAEILSTEPSIDVLVNNAGAMFSNRSITEDGLERTFALNHVAYFVLANALRKSLVAGAHARVINTSSAVHRGAKLDFHNLQSLQGFNGIYAYARSKLYNILFTRELARRLEGSGVTVNSFHPGVVATRFGDESGGLISPGFGLIKRLFGMSAKEGARTLLYLACSAEMKKNTGNYFERCRQVRPSPEAENDDYARRLWEETARLAKLQE
jgi:retinol dehydrogenase 12